MLRGRPMSDKTYCVSCLSSERTASGELAASSPYCARAKACFTGVALTQRAITVADAVLFRWPPPPPPPMFPPPPPRPPRPPPPPLPPMPRLGFAFGFCCPPMLPPEFPPAPPCLLTSTVNVCHPAESFRIFATSFSSHSVNFFVCQKSAASSAQQAPTARSIRTSLFINLSCRGRS